MIYVTVFVKGYLIEKSNKILEYFRNHPNLVALPCPDLFYCTRPQKLLALKTQSCIYVNKLAYYMYLAILSRRLYSSFDQTIFIEKVV